MRLRARVDSNHAVMRGYFEAHGCVVASLAQVGHGTPDLIMGYVPTGLLALVEVKGPKTPTKPSQVAFKAKFPMTFTVRTEQDADHVIAYLKGAGSRGLDLDRICELSVFQAELDASPHGAANDALPTRGRR